MCNVVLLPGAAIRGSHGLDTHSPERPDDLAAEFGVPIEDQVSRDLIVGECLSEPLADPSRCGIGSDANMDNRAPGMVNDEEDTEHSEAHCRHGEEVHRSKAVAVVAQERLPALVSIWIATAIRHVPSNGAL